MENTTKKVGRPKGSLNKSTLLAQQSQKKGNSTYVMNFEKMIEGSAVTKRSGTGYVNWGIKNTYPNILLDLFNQSPTHRSAVNFAVQ